MTEWKSQTGNGNYAIQFETQDYELYKMVEKVCQKAVDEADRKRQKARQQQMSSLGHL